MMRKMQIVQKAGKQKSPAQHNSASFAPLTNACMHTTTRLCMHAKVHACVVREAGGGSLQREDRPIEEALLCVLVSVYTPSCPAGCAHRKMLLYLLLAPPPEKGQGMSRQGAACEKFKCVLRQQQPQGSAAQQ